MPTPSPVSPGDAAPASGPPAAGPLEHALALARERVGDACARNGESIVEHGEGTLAILSQLNVDEPARIAAVLFGAAESLPLEEVAKRFGDEVRTLVDGMRQLLRLQELTWRTHEPVSGDRLETLRRMTLAMASDIRVVLLRLASRLQTLRWHAQVKRAPDAEVSHETLEVLAPLANRLGLGQLKWELEDLAFRFLDPELYRSIARQLEERRVERERFVAHSVERLQGALAEHGIRAEVSGRPKHIRSIYNKMRAKGLSFDEVQDLRAFRVLVPDVRDCYTVLGLVHQMWPPIPREFDDYISRPKSNGYQSLHTVVIAEDGRPLEVQIRTHAMHRHAEFGVASHWRYKEVSTGLPGSVPAGGPGGARGRAASQQDERVEWMRQLLMWQQELGQTLGSNAVAAAGGQDEHIYLLTPQARVVELPAGSTPVDFAYHVHTALGHRCRGARVDGQMVPLNTVLRNGQTVEIVAARAGSGSEGPSRDWLNPQLGYARSARARAKVRQWFNAMELSRDLAAGREKVERVLQREGRTALSHDELARRLEFGKAEDLFVAVAREEVGPRMLEDAVRAAAGGADPARAAGEADAAAPAGELIDRVLQRTAARAGRGATPAQGGGVLVVGMDSLMTQLARCCRPVPPDAIVGFVTRGRGVSVHRADCRSFAGLARRDPDRVLDTSWGEAGPAGAGGSSRPRYPVDVTLLARDRPGLLRDVTEVFARDRINVTAARTQSRSGNAQMQFTAEVEGVAQLNRTLAAVREIDGVIECRRR